MKDDKTALRVLCDSAPTTAEKPSREYETVARSLLECARAALKARSIGAQEFLAANPGVSKIELAKRLNHGVSAFGLIMAIYEDAVESRLLRETARDLLIREIRCEFPDGWSFAGSVAPGIKIGRWYSEASDYCHDQQVEHYLSRIIRHLAIDDPPEEGWLPREQNDPLINEIFDRYWPVETPLV
jgi:hypothetical protein